MTEPLPERLLEGYRAFIAGRHASERQRYRDLAKDGQSPDIMMIACCDSRAAPEMIFDAGPGELFVMRNVANLVPPYAPDGEYHATSAALEYAVQVLKVKHIVVLGHGRCGGIKAALDVNASPLSPGDFIGKWMSMLSAAAKRISAAEFLTAAERQTALERASIRASLDNLRSFPCVSILEGKSRISLHGAWFDIESGELWVMDPATGDFIRPELTPAGTASPLARAAE
ncbi:MAG: carbonic anhydrase [Rhizobiaceae bacterium]|jgi:carbonic anhydrase|nr:carbonic anhydrase [Rhizobiaceae bacterium]